MRVVLLVIIKIKDFFILIKFVNRDNKCLYM